MCMHNNVISFRETCNYTICSLTDMYKKDKTFCYVCIIKNGYICMEQNIIEILNKKNSTHNYSQIL